MTALEDSKGQVHFLPWADFQSEIKVGPVVFWPFYQQLDQKIHDEKLKKYLRKYFQSYVGHEGDPVDSIVICSCGPIDFRMFEVNETTLLREAVDVLIFSVLCPVIKIAVCNNNPSWGPPSADRYQLITQNFSVKSDEIAVQAGNLLSGGWKIGQISFPMPWNIGGGLANPDENFLEGFSGVFGSAFPSDVAKRLFRSLEWFRMAHTEVDEVSNLSRLVMMATAFEILLQFPRNGKKAFFLKYIKSNVVTEKFLVGSPVKIKGKTVELTLAENWAGEFYELRSRILHGDDVEDKNLGYRDWITHLQVADLVFWENVVRILYENKCLGPELEAYIKKYNTILDKVFPNDKELSESLFVSNHFDFTRYHRALGWLPEL